MTEILTSTGVVGPDLNRSEGRAYYTLDNVLTSFESLEETYSRFKSEALSVGRRRVVVRARCVEEVARQAIYNDDLPTEVAIPLNLIDHQTKDFLLVLGYNVHESEVPEWPNVYDYWKKQNNREINPLQRVKNIDHHRYALTKQTLAVDADNLTKMWQPFGWTQDKVEGFVNSHENLWFSGVVDRLSNTIVSACMGEALEFAGITMVEGTEYATLAGHEGQGLCTAAVIGLHAQILDDFSSQDAKKPLIISEFNMSSRSDVVGRHAGMTIPLVENNVSVGFPLQVLRKNVSILDRQNPNSLNWRDLGQDRHHYREAYRTPHRYWRNFITGIIPQENIENFYGPEQREQIFSQYELRSSL